MKSTLLTFFLFLLAGTVLHAQLSFLPQVGFEQSRTALNYGNGMSAMDISGNFKAGLKMDYRFKGGHSPFVNFTTSPSAARFAFNNAGSLESNMPVMKNNLQFRLEAGYQYSSLPIPLGKKSSVSKPSYAASEGATMQRGRCGALRSHCGRNKQMQKAAAPTGGLNVRLQPSLALAYVPSATQSIQQTANGFNYTAGSWKTAIVPAMGFEFAAGRQRLFTLSVFYTKPLDEGADMASLASGVKGINVPLNPKTSTWGLTLGVPFGFAKAAHSKPKMERRQCTRNVYRRCGMMQ